MKGKGRLSKSKRELETIAMSSIAGNIADEQLSKDEVNIEDMTPSVSNIQDNKQDASGKRKRTAVPKKTPSSRKRTKNITESTDTLSDKKASAGESTENCEGCFADCNSQSNSTHGTSKNAKNGTKSTKKIVTSKFECNMKSSTSGQNKLNVGISLNNAIENFDPTHNPLYREGMKNSSSTLQLKREVESPVWQFEDGDMNINSPSNEQLLNLRTVPSVPLVTIHQAGLALMPSPTTTETEDTRDRDPFIGQAFFNSHPSNNELLQDNAGNNSDPGIVDRYRGQTEIQNIDQNPMSNCRYTNSHLQINEETERELLINETDFATHSMFDGNSKSDDVSFQSHENGDGGEASIWAENRIVPQLSINNSSQLPLSHEKPSSTNVVSGKHTQQNYESTLTAITGVKEDLKPQTIPKITIKPLRRKSATRTAKDAQLCRKLAKEMSKSKKLQKEMKEKYNSEPQAAPKLSNANESKLNEGHLLIMKSTLPVEPNYINQTVEGTLKQTESQNASDCEQAKSNVSTVGEITKKKTKLSTKRGAQKPREYQNSGKTSGVDTKPKKAPRNNTKTPKKFTLHSYPGTSLDDVPRDESKNDKPDHCSYIANTVTDQEEIDVNNNCPVSIPGGTENIFENNETECNLSPSLSSSISLSHPGSSTEEMHAYSGVRNPFSVPEVPKSKQSIYFADEKENIMTPRPSSDETVQHNSSFQALWRSSNQHQICSLKHENKTRVFGVSPPLPHKNVSTASKIATATLGHTLSSNQMSLFELSELHIKSNKRDLSSCSGAANIIRPSSLNAINFIEAQKSEVGRDSRQPTIENCRDKQHSHENLDGVPNLSLNNDSSCAFYRRRCLPMLSRDKQSTFGIVNEKQISTNSRHNMETPACSNFVQTKKYNHLHRNPFSVSPKGSKILHKTAQISSPMNAQPSQSSFNTCDCCILSSQNISNSSIESANNLKSSDLRSISNISQQRPLQNNGIPCASSHVLPKCDLTPRLDCSTVSMIDSKANIFGMKQSDSYSHSPSSAITHPHPQNSCGIAVRLEGIDYQCVHAKVLLPSYNPLAYMNKVPPSPLLLTLKPHLVSNFSESNFHLQDYDVVQFPQNHQ